jgi:hypothetical protein
MLILQVRSMRMFLMGLFMQQLVVWGTLVMSMSLLQPQSLEQVWMLLQMKQEIFLQLQEASFHRM